MTADRAETGDNIDRLTTTLALVAAAALVVLRVLFLGQTDLFPEEAYYWNYAAHLDIGYLDHPPMVGWLIHLGTLVFGDQATGVRVPAVLCGLATSFFAWRLAWLLFGKKEAALAVLLVNVTPFFFMTSFMMTPDAPLTACWAGALYFLARALLQERTLAWYGLGICLGLGMLSKYTIALLGPATLLFLALDPAARRWWRHPAPYLAVALSIVIFSPVIVWNARHQWASFAFQSTGRVAETSEFSTHELLAAVLVVLTPLGLFLAWQVLCRRSPGTPDQHGRIRLFTRIYTLTPLGVFLLFSITHPVKLNWTGPLWLALVPLCAATFAHGPSRGLKVAGVATAAFCAALYLVFLSYLGHGLPGVPYARNMALLPVGWAEMGAKLEALRAEVARPSHGPVWLVGMDRNFIASEAAFYSSQPRQAAREITGAHLFRSISLMYEFWMPSTTLRGATLLLVSFNRSDLDRARVQRRTTPAGPIRAHQLTRRGKPLRVFYTRLVKDYAP